jgi:hypothetical protein
VIAVTKPSRLRHDPAGSGWPGDGATGGLTAWAEMGSATSRNRVGQRHNVRLTAPGRSMIVAGGLSETGARRVAEALNEFLAQAISDLFGDAPDAGEVACCALCGAVLVAAGQGRPARYCSPACRQRAYRSRHTH